MTVSPDYIIALVFNTYVPFPGWDTLGVEDLGGQVSPHRCVAEFSGPRVREMEMGRGFQYLLPLSFALFSAPSPVSMGSLQRILTSEAANALSLTLLQLLITKEP